MWDSCSIACSTFSPPFSCRNNSILIFNPSRCSSLNSAPNAYARSPLCRLRTPPHNNEHQRRVYGSAHAKNLQRRQLRTSRNVSSRIFTHVGMEFCRIYWQNRPFQWTVGSNPIVRSRFPVRQRPVTTGFLRIGYFVLGALLRPFGISVASRLQIASRFAVFTRRGVLHRFHLERGWGFTSNSATHDNVTCTGEQVCGPAGCSPHRKVP